RATLLRSLSFQIHRTVLTPIIAPVIVKKRRRTAGSGCKSGSRNTACRDFSGAEKCRSLLDIMRILVTGVAGFIGANFLQRFVPRYPEHVFLNLDKLTYAANLSSLSEVVHYPNYAFVRADIADAQAVLAVFQRYTPDVVVHFAAESHVDRSILGPV